MLPEKIQNNQNEQMTTRDRQRKRQTERQMGVEYEGLRRVGGVEEGKKEWETNENLSWNLLTQANNPKEDT